MATKGKKRRKDYRKRYKVMTYNADGTFTEHTKSTRPRGGPRFRLGRKKWKDSVRDAAMREAHFLAGEMLAQYLQAQLKDVADVYIAAAKGGKIRGTRKTIPLDLTTTRDYIGKFAPPAPRKVDLGLADTADDFLTKVMEGEYEEEEEAEIVGGMIEDKSTGKK